MARVRTLGMGGKAVLLGLLSLAFASAGGCGGKGQSSAATAGTAPASAGSGGGTSQTMGGHPQSAGTSSAGLADGGTLSTGAVSSAGAPAEAGQPATAEGGAAGQAPDWPTGIVNEFGFALEDSWLLMPCLEKLGVGDWFCRPQIGECPNQDAADVEQRGYRFTERFQLGGEIGTAYDVTLRINGVVEGKYYEGGVRRDGNSYANAHQPMGADAWHTGGSPVISTYAIYKLSVFQPDGVTEVDHYYLNSFPQVSGFESHQTVLLGYEATFSVPGQGIVEYLVVDPDCYTNNNCGPGDNVPCANSRGRAIPNQPGLLLPATYGGEPLASLNVMGGENQPFHSQIIHVVVTDVVGK